MDEKKIKHILSKEIAFVYHRDLNIIVLTYSPPDSSISSRRYPDAQCLIEQTDDAMEEDSHLKLHFESAIKVLFIVLLLPIFRQYGR